jgi:hypothetical protein
MLNENTTNNEDDQYCPVIVGDILLHSESKLIPIQVISQSLVRKSSQILETMNIPRVMFNPSELKENQTRILCDLKNSTTTLLKRERTLSTRKFVRLHQVGWTFVKDLKSKVMAINNNTPSNVSTVNPSTNNKQTLF